VQDRDIVAPIVDFSIPRRVRPTFGLVSYEQLKSGKIKIDGKTVRVAPLASIYRSRQVAIELKEAIDRGEFLLTEAVAALPRDRTFVPQDRRQIPSLADE
jgi:L-aspartate semialdehyde sulfurtransferase